MAASRTPPVSDMMYSRTNSLSRSPSLSTSPRVKIQELSDRRAHSKASKSPGGLDSRQTSKGSTRAASKSSRQSSSATVQDFISYVEKNPFEFEQSIQILRLADSVKSRHTDRGPVSAAVQSTSKEFFESTGSVKTASSDRQSANLQCPLRRSPATREEETLSEIVKAEQTKPRKGSRLIVSI
mmetsp:Transcript_46826/g.83994  ORF Transcript_46826/g.83994 Transcript_46826/m.83994 type:complete len:183 (+) Transcript_46826:50-598(+)